VNQWPKPILVIAGLLLCRPVCAHDYWVDPGDFRPAVGAETTIRLCSGHSFPKKSADTHGYEVHEGRVITPSGVAVSLKVENSGEGKSAAFALQTNGTYMVCLSMTSPGKKEPSYWTRALVVAGGEVRAKHELRTGKGMEIVPGTALHRLRVGDKLPLSVAYDGRMIRALVTTAREDGTVSHIRSSPRRPAMVKISKSGKYLAVASVAGRKCSLAFAVAETSGSGPEHD